MLTYERLKEALDYNPVNGLFIWKIKRAGKTAGTKHPHGYNQIRIDKKHYLAHRLAWLYMTGEWPKGQIDHKNLNKEDDSFENLRDSTPTQNNGNMPLRIDNTSGMKGVYFCKFTGRWCAKIHHRKLRYHLGRFDTLAEAHAAYCAAAKEKFGEFARVS